jgi:hypothetical protein
MLLALTAGTSSAAQAIELGHVSFGTWPGLYSNLSADGHRVALCAEFGKLHVYDTSGWVPTLSSTIVDSFITPGWDLNRISISGNTIAVGDRDSYNVVRLYDFVGGAWVASTTIGSVSGYTIASDLSLDGDTLLIGSPDDLQRGAVLQYARTGGVWQHQATFRSQSTLAGDAFGETMARSMGTLVVGSPGSDIGAVDSGAVTVFESVGTAWVEKATLFPAVAAPNQQFGRAVHCTSDYIAVGTPSASVSGVAGAGNVTIFARSLAGWQRVATVTSPNPSPGDRLGTAVHVAPGRVYAGAPRTNHCSGSGSVLVFDNTPLGWNYSASITPSACSVPRLFGQTLDVSGGKAIVGAAGSFLAGAGTDGCYIFELCGPIASYCTGGTTANGCQSYMTASGVPSASASSGFVVSAVEVEGDKYGIIFYGTGQSSFLWAMGGTSFVCVAPPHQRTGRHLSGGSPGTCQGVLSVDMNQFLSSNPTAIGAPYAAGTTLHAQAWFRDPGSPKQTSLSNGLTFTLCQ